jgi:catechol 2,3-dioxygenase-like lactoylglutathione lyase family enzyme
MIEGPFTGGCLCGAIRYEVDRIFDVIYCHCNQCRRSSGAPVMLTAQVSGDAFRLTKGTPSEYRTSDSGRSLFCGTCGSGQYGEYAPPNHPLVRDGRYFSVRVGTFDDPQQVRPQIHQFVEDKLPWFDTIDRLPRLHGNVLPHPDKRGPAQNLDREPMGGFARLVPELHVSDLDASLAFWRDTCGFSIAYRRDEERFVFLELQGAQIMLCQRHGRYETGTMEHALGQGAMFQVYLEAVEPVLSALRKSGWSLYEEPRESWYRAGEHENGLRQFMVQDPDGYLIMFAESLGTRPTPGRS